MSNDNLPARRPDDEPKSAAIYIGPGAKNIRTQRNLFIGYDTAIIDHGESNTHLENAVLSAVPEPQNPVENLEGQVKEDGKNDKKWYEKPIGNIGVSVTAALIAAAALYAIAHYASPQ